MRNKKTYTNHKFPNKSIDIFFDDVYGGGTVHQYKDQKSSPQAINLAKKALDVFITEIEKEGWK